MERLAGRIVLLWGWKRRAAAFAAGALAVLSQPPYDFFAACFIAFPVLVWLLDGAAGDGGRSILSRIMPFFATGWWFGFGYFLAGLWWIGRALLVEADAHAWAMPFAVLGLPAVLALFFGLACLLAIPFWRHDLGRIFALAFGFGVAEWLRARELLHLARALEERLAVDGGLHAEGGQKREPLLAAALRVWKDLLPAKDVREHVDTRVEHLARVH